MKIFILLCILSCAALAQVQIQVVDPDVDPATFDGDGYQVQTKQTPHLVLPELGKRDALFKEIKLPPTWDQLDKDIFYMDLKSKSIEKLEIKYPQFGREKLKQLKVRRD